MTLHVVFAVGSVEYALPVSVVLMMESYTHATAVPGAAPYVAGIVTVRGRVVPVIDLRVRFGLAPAEATLDNRIIVAQLGARVVALRVDSAREVVLLDESSHQAAPLLISERANGFVTGVQTLGPRLLLLVDLPKILGEENHEPESPFLSDGARSTHPPALRN